MKQLVFIQSNRPVTDSLIIAESFGKEHRRVLQDIRDILNSFLEGSSWGMHHFVQTTYKHDQNGQEYPKYIISEQGFTLLVMGYTGERAMKFKVDYIEQFHNMRDELTKPQFALPQTMPEALRLLAAEMEQKAIIAADKLLLENTLDSQRPLVAFAETCMDSDRNMLVREVAKLASKDGIMIGEKRLYNKLRDWGLVFQQRTEPTQRAMEMGIFQIIKGVRQTPKGARDWETSKVTPKGQMYIIDRLRKDKGA